MKNENKVLCNFVTVIALTFMVILLLNFFTPIIADDFGYSAGNKNFFTMINQFSSFYMTWGGGFTSFLFTKILLLLPKYIFNLLNAFVYISIILCIYYLIVGTFRILKIHLLLLIIAILWFIPPTWGQDFLWTNGSTAYSWTTLIILLLCCIINNSSLNKSDFLFYFICTISFILSVLAGWAIANYSVSICTLILCFFIYNNKKNEKKPSLLAAVCLIGSLIGSTLLIAAPGNYVRMSAFTDTRPFIVKLASRFINITINTIETFHILIPVFIALVAYLIITKQYKKLITPGIYFISFLASFYSMIMSPTFPDRAMLLGIVFFIISLLKLYEEVEKSVDFKKTECIAVISLSCLVLPVSLYKAARNIYHFNAGWKQRIAYINEQKEQGNLNVKVPIIKIINPHVSGYDLIDLSKDPNEFPNPSIANYFGLESITGYEE